MLVFNNYFYKNKKSKLYFGDRVAVLNDFLYQTGGSNLPQTSKGLVMNLLASFTTHTHGP
jgi:hypothetical protein